MKVTVCQLDANTSKLDDEWTHLVNHCKRSNAELVLLPEMPFNPWITCFQKLDHNLWKESCKNQNNFDTQL